MKNLFDFIASVVNAFIDRRKSPKTVFSSLGWVVLTVPTLCFTRAIYISEPLKTYLIVIGSMPIGIYCLGWLYLLIKDRKSLIR